MSDLVRQSLDLEADILDSLGRHDEAEAARARVPMVYPGSPNVRKTDPIESHIAADLAVSRRRTLRAVYFSLKDAGEPMTADHIWELARLKGFQCTPERVRTVLAEGERDGIFQPIEGGTSQWGNPCRLWTLKEWDK